MNAARTQDVTYVSATLADFGGLQTGDVVYQPNVNGGIDRYILLKGASTTTPNNRLVKRDATVGAEVTASLTALTTDVAIAVNNTGKTIPLGQYYFGKQTNYEVESDGGGTIAPGVPLMPSDVGGGNDGRCEAFSALAGRTSIGINNTNAAAAVTVLRVIGELPSVKSST